MRTVTTSILVTVLCLLAVTAAPAKAQADDDPWQSVSTMLLDKDKEVRAIGLEEVRDGLKGPEATRKLVALLPQLTLDGRAALVIALGDRGDTTALPAVQKLIACDVPAIRAAAIRAVGALGGKNQAAVLVPLLGKPECQQDAAAAILCLQGAGIHEAVLAEAKRMPALRAKVFPLLVTLHAVDVVPELLAAADDADANVRMPPSRPWGNWPVPSRLSTWRNWL